MRKIKHKVYELLTRNDEERAIKELLEIPLSQSINSLFSFIQHTDEIIKWRAVRAMGRVTAEMAAERMEDARVVMRRLMWSLNDESGGIGWGAPEAMGEIAARDRRLADEYSNIIFSYVDPDGNYLEHDTLRKGADWAVARIKNAYPDLKIDKIERK